MAEQDTRPFKIVHLSDLHLTASDRDARSEPRLFGKLTGMNDAFRYVVKAQEIKDADIVLVTGDIADTGDIEEWRIFWDTLLDAGIDQKKVLAIPGNHDVCCLGWRFPVLDGKGASKADMEKAVAGLRLGNQPEEFPWVRVPDPRVVIFGLNSNNLGNASFFDNAFGKIVVDHLHGLARLLVDYRSVPVKIVALHHSPNLPQRQTMIKRFGKDYHATNRWLMAIPQDERRALRSLCVEHKVRLILHGHVHLDEDRRVNGIRIVGTPATTQPLAGKAGERGYECYSYAIGGVSNRVRVRPIRIRL